MALDGVSQEDVEDSTELLEELAASVPGVLFKYWVSADGTQRRFPFISSRVTELFEIPVEVLNCDGNALAARVHPDEVRYLRPSVDESARTLSPWQFQARMWVRGGCYQWFEGHAIPRRLEDGSTLWFGQFTNIQSHKELELSLRASEVEAEYQLRFHQLLANLSSNFINSPIGDIEQETIHFLASIGDFFQVDRVYIYRFSEDFSKMTNTHEWCSAEVESLMGDQQEVDITGFCWWQEQIRDTFYRNEVVFVSDVEQLPVEAVEERALLEEQGVASMFCTPLQVRGRVDGFFGMDSLQSRQWRTDISDLLILIANLLSQALERFRLEQEMLSQSVLDPLTGIHNRRYLAPRVDEMLANYQRSGEGIALAMLDIDHFKQINDTHGHQAGDRILTHFAGLLQSQCRGSDVAARYGGEEFIVALSDVSPEKAARALKRILELVRGAMVDCAGTDVAITVSIGLVHVTDLAGERLDADVFITEADRRLYRAKRAGRDCLVDGAGIVRP